MVLVESPELASISDPVGEASPSTSMSMALGSGWGGTVEGRGLPVFA